jgi:predicted nucleic acid-binding protein
MAERPTFVDTNILAYAHDRSETHRRPIAQAVLESLWEDRAGAVSTQVLQELYVVVTRKFGPPMRHATARELVAVYGEWRVVQVDAPLILAASQLQERHGFSFWDALIVESATRSGATRLLTEDLEHGREIGGVTIENPFA